jgi:hypothetical protein
MEVIEATAERNTPSDFFPWRRPKPGESHKVCSLFLMVASFGPAEDWAVYYGPPSWTPERVAAEGDKLSREAAMVLFPNVVGYYRD